jgi:tetratricopeptide (TPR) repeat protein
VCLALALACVSFPVAAQQPSLGALAKEVESRRAPQPQQPPPTEADRARAAARLPITAPWKSEQEWIVSDIVGAIYNITAAANGTGAQGTVTARAVAGPGQGVTLEISDHLWAPAAYVPTARAAIVNRPATCAPAGNELIGALLDPTTEIIQRENVRISAKLAADLRCPGSHEQAALLIGSLALREAAGVFTDTRRLISRMTAHLAVADALRTQQASSRVRVLADAVHLTLVGRQTDALERLRALGAIGDDLDLQAWDRALRIRITEDWRLLESPRRATLFEQLAWFRALTSRLGEEAALNRYDSLQEPIDVVDWGRMLLEPADGAGVEGGNRFGEPTLLTELDDIGQVWRDFFPGELTSTAEIVNALNEEPRQGPAGANGIRVIDWGLWAATTQRHLLMEINALDTHLQNVLAVRGRGKDYRNGMRDALGRLRLFPLLAVSFAGTPGQLEDSFAAAVRLARTRPELLTDWIWKCLITKDATAPASATWFYPFFPMGTLYDVDHRPFAAGNQPRFAPAQIAAFRERAPYARELAFEATNAVKATSLESLTAIYGRMADYDLRMAIELANKTLDNPAEYARRYERIAGMDPGERLSLAEYLADRGDGPGAVRQYEQWLETSDNEVSISHGVDWLLRHYFESGEQEKATRLADRVAKVYSYAGLRAKANLLDWRGDSAGAETLLRKGVERYEYTEPADLLAFYLRHDRKGKDVDRLAKAIFPSGMKRVTSASFRGVPASGALIRYGGEIGRKNGLLYNDVVVAVDGYEVTNRKQFDVAAGMSTNPVMRMIVFRTGHYLEVSARVRYGWVWGDIRDYKVNP